MCISEGGFVELQEGLAKLQEGKTVGSKTQEGVSRRIYQNKSKDQKVTPEVMKIMMYREEHSKKQDG